MDHQTTTQSHPVAPQCLIQSLDGNLLIYVNTRVAGLVWPGYRGGRRLTLPTSRLEQSGMRISDSSQLRMNGTRVLVLDQCRHSTHIDTRVRQQRSCQLGVPVSRAAAMRCTYRCQARALTHSGGDLLSRSIPPLGTVCHPMGAGCCRAPIAPGLTRFCDAPSASADK